MVSEPESKKFGTEKISEPESKKIGTEKSLGTGIENFWYRKKSRNRSRKILVPKTNIGTGLEIFQNISIDLGLGLVPFPGFCNFFYGIGTGLEKKLVPKKVSEPVSKKMSTEKKSRNQSRKILVPKKVSESVWFRFWVSSHTDQHYVNPRQTLQWFLNSDFLVDFCGFFGGLDFPVGSGHRLWLVKLYNGSSTQIVWNP